MEAQAVEFSTSAFARLFFSELERLNIPYVLLHSFQRFPEQVTSDIDFAVLSRDVPRLPQIQAALAEQHGWRLAQVLRAHVYSLYSVVINPEDPGEYLQLDACSHYVEKGCFFFRDSELLEQRKRLGDFYVAAPDLEFGYLVAKSLSKARSVEPKLARLRELHAQDAGGTEERFRDLFGHVDGALKQWLHKPASEWEKLRPALLKRHQFGWPDRLRELSRWGKRVRSPAGLHLAVLGPDGAGKSTLVEHLGPMLVPTFFRQQRVFHFRPKVLEGNTEGPAVTAPHGQPPRSRLAGCAKLLFYFADHLAGYWLKVFPAKVRNELIIFCRNFDDVLVDPRRYRLAESGGLAAWLQRLLPRPDLTLVLDAEPEQVLARKAELSMDELTRQRSAFSQLVSSGPGYILLSSAEEPHEVARAACAKVIEFLSERLKQRGVA